MNDERFIAHMNDSANAVACMKGCTRARIIFDRAMIIAVLYILLQLFEQVKPSKRSVAHRPRNDWRMCSIDM